MKNFFLANIPFIGYLTMPACVYAAEKAGDPGLPQLDTTNFPGQLFWVFVIFSILVVLYYQWLIPALSKTIDNRNTIIRDENESARKLSDEAEDIRQQYEEKLKQGRQEANNLYIKVMDEIKNNEERELEKFKIKADEKLESLYSEIKKEKEKAKEDINLIAAEIAAEAANKIISVDIDIDQAKSAVRSFELEAKAA